MKFNLLATPARRRWLYAALYFSEGAPIGFIWWTLPAKLRLADVPVEQITVLTAGLVLPWSFKFLMAPFIDTLRSPRWGFKQWVMTMQILMGLCLLPLLFLDFKTQFGLVYALLMLHAISAATQDLAIDGMAVQTVAETQTGEINGWMQTGMLLGRALFGAGALMVSQYLGTRTMVAALIATIWLTTFTLLFVDEPKRARGLQTVSHELKEFFNGFKDIITRKTTWLGFLVAAISGAAMQAVGTLAGPFMVDHGYTEAQVGVFFSISVVFMLAGSLLGGRLSDRFGKPLCVGLFVCFISLCIFVLPALPVPGIMAVMMIAHLGFGMYTSAIYALFMGLTDPKLGSTHFSTYMSGINICEVWSTYTVGLLFAGTG
jgi:MFS family permease